MTPTELILLLNALANLIAAIAQLLAVWRSPRALGRAGLAPAPQFSEVNA